MKTIQLSQGKVTLVDDADYEWLSNWKWCATMGHTTFYAQRNAQMSDGSHHTVLMHRQILGLEYGDPRQGDHVNGKGLDNRIDNLRIVTHQENHFNRRAASGWWFCHRKGKYAAELELNAKKIWLGYHNTPEEARSAYLAGKAKYHQIIPRLALLTPHQSLAASRGLQSCLPSNAFARASYPGDHFNHGGGLES